jgi:hypothetical protein
MEEIILNTIIILNFKILTFKSCCNFLHYVKIFYVFSKGEMKAYIIEADLQNTLCMKAMMIT